MPDADPGLMTIFAEALERTDPADRAAYLDGACAGRRRPPPAGRGAARRPRRGRPVPGSRRHRHVRTRPHPKPWKRPRRPRRKRVPRRNRRPGNTRPDGTIAAVAGAPPADRPRRIRRGPGHRRPVHAARSPRRGGDGHRLPGRSDRTGQAAGGAEADQDRHGLARGAGPVRRRAAGAGPDGPPQHRPRLRRRHHRGRPAVLRDGAGRAACRSPSTATASGSRSGPGWSCSSPSARRCSTPTRRGSSTAT